MGRVKGAHIKAIARTLVEKSPDAFGADFEVNKAKIKEMGLLKDSKKEQKKLAGEVTVYMKRLMKKESTPTQQS